MRLALGAGRGRIVSTSTSESRDLSIDAAFGPPTATRPHPPTQWLRRAPRSRARDYRRGSLALTKGDRKMRVQLHMLPVREDLCLSITGVGISLRSCRRIDDPGLPVWFDVHRSFTFVAD
jgi:hypothetical protein